MAKATPKQSVVSGRTCTSSGVSPPCSFPTIGRKSSGWPVAFWCSTKGPCVMRARRSLFSPLRNLPSRAKCSPSSGKATGPGCSCGWAVRSCAFRFRRTVGSSGGRGCGLVFGWGRGSRARAQVQCTQQNSNGRTKPWQVTRQHKPDPKPPAATGPKV